MNPRKHQQGLTLIEVLVILAILVIMVILLLPVLSRDTPARSVHCLGNLKQINLGLRFYAEDNANKFPNLDSQSGNDGPAALSLISPYIKQTDTYFCPWVAYQRQQSRGVFQKPFQPVMDRFFFISNGNDYAYYDGLSTKSISNPSTAPITADRLAWTNRSAIDKKLLNHPDAAINIGFADGHVERVRPNIVIGTNYTPPWSRIQDPIRVH